MDQPLVSVVIPVHGEAPYLEETLRSVAGQTWPAVDVVIVDDRASAGLAARVRAILAGARIVEAIGHGAGAARNTGTDAAHGEYVAYLDADDIWVPEKLAVQVEAITANPAVGVVCSAFYDYYRGRVTCVRPRRTRFREGDALRAVLLDEIALPSTILCRTECVQAAGGWPTDAQFEDTRFFVALAAQYDFRFLPRPLVYYRRHDANRHMQHRSGRLEAFLSVLQQARELRPDIDARLSRLLDAQAHFIASYWHREGGRRGRALREAARAVALNPRNYRYHLVLVRACLPGAVDRTIPRLERALFSLRKRMD
ncbi:MAG TPA: glycosyltransferase family 2 protein [Gammaproteobacteria bacterium]|nr:glycosyltransferase family 2 protein [Gammaproteobacteria bacterium]